MRIKKKFIFEIGWTQWPASLLEVVLSFESERSLFYPRTMAVKSVDLSLPVRRPKCSSATFRKKKNMHPTSVHSGFLKLKIFPNELSTEPWWRWNRRRCTQHFLPPLLCLLGDEHLPASRCLFTTLHLRLFNPSLTCRGKLNPAWTARQNSASAFAGRVPTPPPLAVKLLIW